MSEPFLKARNLFKVYENGRKGTSAVNGISIGIERGKFTSIVGPSGAGKSTLLHLLGALDRPSSGDVVLDGADIYKLSDRERAAIRNSRIGFVFQFYHLLPEFTALENVMLPYIIRNTQYALRNRKAREMAINVLTAVGLKDRYNHKPGELSGGESQRVAIARALVNEPQILLCDEPTGNLDSKNSEAIYELLFSIKSKADMALVVVTHDERISEKADLILRIKDGKLV